MTKLTIPGDTDACYRVTLPPAPDLSRSLLAYQRQNLFCDVVLRCRRSFVDEADRSVDVGRGAKKSDGGFVTIPAHKVVLAAASSFFRSAIDEDLASSPLTMNSCPVIAIPEPADHFSMKIIVEWIYGGLRVIKVGGARYVQFIIIYH